jgi:hypothetical protein
LIENILVQKLAQDPFSDAAGLERFDGWKKRQQTR